MSIYSDFAVRLYVNPKYGKFVRPGKTNPFIFNGSVGFASTTRKFYVDLADFDHLTDSLPDLDDYGMRSKVVDVARAKLGYAGANPADFAAGQLFELPDGEKHFVIGYVVMNMTTYKAYLVLVENETAVAKDFFVFRSCAASSTKGKAPDFLGANYDLRQVAVTARTASTPSPEVAQMLATLSARKNS